LELAETVMTVPTVPRLAVPHEETVVRVVEVVAEFVYDILPPPIEVLGPEVMVGVLRQFDVLMLLTPTRGAARLHRTVCLTLPPTHGYLRKMSSVSPILS